MCILFLVFLVVLCPSVRFAGHILAMPAGDLLGEVSAVGVGGVDCGENLFEFILADVQKGIWFLVEGAL
jgi:hypothetical protein